MSQAKVERYKESKKNRKETVAREKKQRTLNRVIAGVVCAVILGWIGYSGYQVYENSKPLETVYVDMTELNDYMSSLEVAE